MNKQFTKLRSIMISFMAAMLFFSFLFVPLNAVDVGPPESKIDDEVGVLSDQTVILDKMNELLGLIEGQSIYLKIIPTLNEKDIDSFTDDLYHSLYADDGDNVIILIALNDRKLRVHTGKSMRQVLTDSIADDMINSVKTDFKSENYQSGIESMLNCAVDSITNQENVVPQGVDKTSQETSVDIDTALGSWFTDNSVKTCNAITCFIVGISLILMLCHYFLLRKKIKHKLNREEITPIEYFYLKNKSFKDRLTMSILYLYNKGLISLKKDKLEIKSGDVSFLTEFDLELYNKIKSKQKSFSQLMQNHALENIMYSERFTVIENLKKDGFYTTNSILSKFTICFSIIFMFFMPASYLSLNYTYAKSYFFIYLICFFVLLFVTYFANLKYQIPEVERIIEEYDSRINKSDVDKINGDDNFTLLYFSKYPYIEDLSDNRNYEQVSSYIASEILVYNAFIASTYHHSSSHKTSSSTSNNSSNYSSYDSSSSSCDCGSCDCGGSSGDW